MFSRGRRLWAKFEHEAGFDAPRSFVRLYRAYASRTRAYHWVRHVVDVVDRVTSIGRSLSQRIRPALIAAGWYHDCVYNSRRADNEERSADVLVAELRRAGVNVRITRAAAKMVIETTRHRPRALDSAAKILIDADLAVLASPAPSYDTYAAGIRREYAWVDHVSYRNGRAHVLRSFLERPKIYRTRAMRAREIVARQNLERELRMLSDGIEES